MLARPRLLLSAVVVAALVAGCAPALVEGNASGGIVENKSSLGIGLVGVEVGTFSERARQASLERADRHCAQFGKRARIVVKGDNALQFECVGGENAAPAPKS
jgi:hypothetical protein